VGAECDGVLVRIRQEPLEDSVEQGLDVVHLPVLAAVLDHSMPDG